MPHAGSLEEAGLGPITMVSRSPQGSGTGCQLIGDFILAPLVSTVKLL